VATDEAAGVEVVDGPAAVGKTSVEPEAAVAEEADAAGEVAASPEVEG
jgi:hypothetical protein